MAIRNEAPAKTSTTRAAQPEGESALERKKKPAKKLLVKLGLAAATTAMVAATGGAGLVAKIGTKVAAKAAPVLGKAVTAVARELVGFIWSMLWEIDRS